MYKIRFLLLLPLFFTFSENLYASCEIWEPGTTSMSACIEKEEAGRTEGYIQEQYDLLMKVFKKYNDSRNAEMLKESQESWLVFRQKECALEESVFGGIGHVSTANCERKLAETRLEHLNELLGAYDTSNL